MDQGHEHDQAGRRGLLISGSIIFGFGLLFLLVNLDILPNWDVIWPIIIIIVGLSLILGALTRKGKNKEI